MMHTRKLAIAALIILGIGTAAYATTDANALRDDVNVKAPSQGKLSMTISDGVVHIFGYARASDIARAKRLAEHSDGVNRVIVTATAIN